MGNYIEELVGEYYKMKGYFVMTNYWIPFNTNRARESKGKQQEYSAQSWTDIDVLAKNEKELLIIQVKTTINTKETPGKIKVFFKRVEDFLKISKLAPCGENGIYWSSENCIIKKIIVYEYKNSPKSYLKILTDEGIEAKYFGDLLKEIIKYIEDKKGLKEGNSTMRFLHFLCEHKMLIKKI